MIQVAIIAIPEALPSSIFGPLDVLRACAGIARLTAAGRSGPAFSVKLVALKEGVFTSFNGVSVTPDVSVENAGSFDLVWIPSLALSPSGLFNPYPELQQWIRHQHRHGAEILTVCTGAFLLAETGLLDRQKCTTHWAYANLFTNRYPKVELQPHLSIVHNPTMHCAAAGSAWHDLVLNVIERYCDKRTAVQTAKLFLLQTHPRVQQAIHHLTSTQRHHDAMIDAAERWLAAHLSEEDLIARAAAEVQLTEVTFKRRFKQALNEPPSQYIQRLRVDKAKEALELTQHPVEDISAMVGYRDSSFFRRLFKRLTGLTPAQYRRLFST